MRILSVGFYFQTSEIEFIFTNVTLKTKISKFKQLKCLSHKELLKHKIKKNYVEWNDIKVYIQEIVQLLRINLDNKNEVIHKIPICKINEISNDNKLFLNNFSIPFKSTINLPVHVIQILLKLNPPLVRKVKGDYECIANTIQFRIAKKHLSEDAIIPARITSRSEIKNLGDYLFCDIYIKPLIFSLNKQEYSFLYKAWIKLLNKNNSLINSINLPKSKSSFAKLFNIDKRQLDE